MGDKRQCPAGERAEVASPAKVNLFLHVIARRADGYHDLASLMCPVSLYDKLRVVFVPKGIEVLCSHPAVPDGADNLAAKAISIFLRAYKTKTGRCPSGIHVDIEKNIPVAAGLGGGSSNAAAVLSVMNQYHGRVFTHEQMAEMAGQVGADVPFFLLGKPALATGIGDRLQPVDGLPAAPVLMVNPGFEVSTAEVYKSLNLALTNCKKTHNYINFEAHRFDFVKDLHNDLETVATSKFSEVFAIKKELKRVGAINALMSGSGPTVFGLFSDMDAVGRARSMLDERMGWSTFSAALITGDKGPTERR
jgi:4-diphosphocytidyl-2-C-methyl-D-erythritol kinase